MTEVTGDCVPLQPEQFFRRKEPFGEFICAKRTPVLQITHIEAEILDLVGSGRTAAEIAEVIADRHDFSFPDVIETVLEFVRNCVDLKILSVRPPERPQ